MSLTRRGFLGAVPAAAAAWLPVPAQKTAARLEAFDYTGVRLLPSRWKEQVDRARDVYLHTPNDDILKGFRIAAGHPAPGRHMTGWCTNNSAVIFGQLLSGMARMGRALEDPALLAKAVELSAEWQKTVGSGGDARMDAYCWEKLVCGLVDLHLYAGDRSALPALEKSVAWAARTFDRSRTPASHLDPDGRRPAGTNEWYTLPENLYRAYLASGNSVFRDFARIWHYDTYWRKFESSPRPADAHSVHAYSHVNSFCSAAAAYEATGEARYLEIVRNGIRFVEDTQAYATGGYGPGERLVESDGALGRALELRSETAEVPCGSWAGFKLARYMLRFTGEAAYGDWAETLLYNGIGAALATQPDGRTFYYADYRLGGGAKLYFWDEWPCCAGSYLQAVADYHNLIYFRSPGTLYVNLYVPSEVEWEGVTVRQETAYPESESSSITFRATQPRRFGLRFRVPRWAEGATVQMNGRQADVPSRPGSWGEIEREWHSGDRVEIRIPAKLRLAPVDAAHPRRAAVACGPVVLAQEARFTRRLTLDPGTPIERRLERTGPGLTFDARDAGPQDMRTGSFRPFYSFPERLPYRIYFDLGDQSYI